MAMTPKIPQLMAPNSHRQKKRMQSMPKADGLPEAPDWLSAQQTKIFDRLCAEFLPLCIAKRIDSEAIAMLASALFEYQSLTKDIRKHGNLLTGRDGGLVANPLLGKRDSAWLRYCSLLKDFGCTPRSRAAIAIGIENEKDEFLD